jgi:hypothetical protein
MSTRYPLCRRLGGPQNLPERREEHKILEPIRIRTPPPGRPARKESLYRLCYVLFAVLQLRYVQYAQRVAVCGGWVTVELVEREIVSQLSGE